YTYHYTSEKVNGQHYHGQGQESAIVPPVFFDKDEYAAVSRIADLIIPPTQTAGAVQAGVPSYIELVVSRNPEHQPIYKQGLLWVDRAASEKHAKSFVQLTEDQQIALLTPLCEAADGDRL